MDYDLIVLGAGPSGLMTSKTAAQNGLNVLLVEPKKEIAENLRLCAAMLYTKPGFHGDTMRLEEDRIVFLENDFTVRYDGGYRPLNEWCYVSPGGYRFRAGKKESPAGMVIDKNVLIRRLLEDVVDAEVTLWNESMGLEVKNTDDGVDVLVKKHYGEPEWLSAKKCVVCDGIVSNITKNSFPDIWKNRAHLAGATGVSVVVEQLDCPWDDTLIMVKNEIGNVYFIPKPAKGSDGKHIWEVIGFNTMPRPNQDQAMGALNFVLETKPFSDWFKNANTIGKGGCAWDIFSPILEPAIGNTLLVGDVCAMQEVDNQGAVCCGFRAGNAVLDEIEGKEGFKAYTEWWQEAFEFNHGSDAALQLARGFGLFTLGTDVLDYFFSIMENEVMNSYLDHHKLGTIIEAGFRKHRERMIKERPEIVEKMDAYFDLSPEEAYKGKKD